MKIYYIKYQIGKTEKEKKKQILENILKILDYGRRLVGHVEGKASSLVSWIKRRGVFVMEMEDKLSRTLFLV